MDSEETKRPIGIFDSGMGGLTVLRECVKIMGNEDYIFMVTHSMLRTVSKARSRCIG